MKQALSDNGIPPAACGRGSYRMLGGRERIRPRPGAPATNTLLVGFDSAWTRSNSGSVVGVLQLDDGTYRALDPPRIVNYREAECVILKWQAEHVPTATIVLLDQPTIVGNAAGQRPVENLVASPVSRRYGGMQPANTARTEMFGEEAPVWRFLARFGGPADPLVPVAETQRVRNVPGADNDCARLDAARLTPYRSVAQVQPGAEKDLLDLGLAACLRVGVRRVPCAWTRGDRSVDPRRWRNHAATQARSGLPGCLLVLDGRAVLGRAGRLPNGRRSSDWLHHRAVQQRASCGTRSPVQPDWSSAVGVGASIPGAGERAGPVDIVRAAQPVRRGMID